MRRPSPALVVAIIAVVIATAGTAFAATGSLVTIVDPADATKTAHVDAKGRLEVGDGSGSLTVDGTTISHEAAPDTFFSGHAFPAPGGGCAAVATSPPSKARVIKSVSMDTWDLTVAAGTYYRFSVGSSCGSGILDVNPPTTGLLVQPFEPGIGVPANQTLWVQANGNLTGEAFAYGYTVAASAVPAAAPAAAPQQKPGAPPDG